MYARSLDSFLAFLARHERPLATFIFISGFVTDLLTFGLLDLPSVTLLFAAYLAIAVLCTFVAHAAHSSTGSRLFRALAVLGPLGAQFVFGSLLSGFLIFYTKSAVLSVSWPFLLLLALIFFGNEVFRSYRDHLIFQTLLVYFSLYAFAVFALPLVVDRIGTLVFLASTAISLAAFGLYLFVLRILGRERLQEAFKAIVGTTAALTVVIVISYVAGLLPPIPLTLKDGGVYHSFAREGTGYVGQAEPARPWYDPRPQTVHHVDGTSLYAYSAVFAPGKFTASIMHVWQRYDPAAKEWKDESTIAFPLSGGRAGGYRGYTLKNDPEPGKWRVLVKTLNGQTIGEFRFDVVDIPVPPVLETRSL